MHVNEILKMEGINKIYGEAVSTQVLYDINLSFQAGSFNSIIGQSGSGKSTLLNIMGTLDRPTSGTIQIGEEEISKLSARKLSLLRNDWLGFVFQFHYLLPEFTALENVAMPLMLRQGTNFKDVQKQAEYLLERVGLTHRLTHKPGELSGGERQRVALARALVAKPALMMADEPTGNLDRKTASKIFELLMDLRQEFNMAMLIVTHDEQLAQSADSILHMQDGLWVND